MTVGVGIVGYGGIASVHRRALEGSVDARLVAVVNRRGGQVDGVRVYRDYGDFLADPGVDLVVVCSPSGLHADQALAALRSGRHVVVEKPFTLDVEAGRHVVAEARERGLLVSVMSQRRFTATAQALHAAVGEGRLGRLILGEVLQRWHRDQDYYDSAPWRGTWAMDGGVLMNQAIHAIDLLRWLLGPVEKVYGSCATLTHDIEVEDSAVAAFRFRSGALGVASATTSAAIGTLPELTLTGSAGAVSLAGTDIARWEVPGVPAPVEEESWGSGQDSPLAISEAGHRRQWQDILAALAEGRDPLVTGEEGLASAALVLAIYQSWRSGRPVRPEEY